MRKMSVLVLNQNYEPLNICDGRRAIRLIFKNKAEVIDSDQSHIHSEKLNLPTPSIIRLYKLIRRRKLKVSFNRRNILRRDKFTCQYCGNKPPAGELTLDHITPRSKGGGDSWENVVAACKRCNNVKADQSPSQAGMRLLKKPGDPSRYPPMLLSWKIPEHRQNWRIYFFMD